MIFDDITNEYICSKCGFVSNGEDEMPKAGLDEYLKRGNYKVVNNNILVYQNSLNTVIRNPEIDGYSGERIKDNKAMNMAYKLKFYNAQSSNNEFRRYKTIYNIDVLSDKLNLPDAIVNRISYLYIKVSNDKFTRGRIKENVLSACTYMACKENNVLRNMKEICNAINANYKVSYMYYKTMVQLYGEHKPNITDKEIHIQQATKLINNIELDHKIRRYVYDIIDFIYDKCPHIMGGKKPVANVTAIIWLACRKFKFPIGQQELMDYAGISTTAIRYKSKFFRDIINEYDSSH